MEESRQAKKKILVIDDEEINRRVLTRLLTSFGHEAVTAASGREGLDLLGPEVDLVLLDIMMPDMDGFAVCRVLRSMEPYREIPVIMVTALTAKEDRLLAVEAGASDFVSKPIDSTELGCAWPPN